MAKTLKKRKYKKRNKIGKGLFNIFTRKNNHEIELPLSTMEELNIISKPIDDVKEIFEKHSSNIERLYHECRNICKSYDCLGNELMCEQLNDMIEKRSIYEWGNFCANTLNKEECKHFLKSYKILEIYTSNLIELGNKALKVKEILDNIK